MEGVTILVVDDERGMRETVVEILASAGYSVSEANAGDVALEHITRNDFDIVVMDIRMPGMDGVSVLEQMGSPPPQVILMTGYANEERLRQAVVSHAFAIVHKPFAASYLLRLIEDAVAA